MKKHGPSDGDIIVSLVALLALAILIWQIVDPPSTYQGIH